GHDRAHGPRLGGPLARARGGSGPAGLLARAGARQGGRVIGPDEALERAREAAKSMRAGGAYPAAESAPQPAPGTRPTIDQLIEWSVVEPDLREVRSTRRLG